MPDLSTGAVFAGHRIEGVAGRGGMGVVYRATHLALDHVVALKVISPNLAGDPRFRRRFADESRIAVSLRHPNVVQIHHAGEEDGLLFVTMDLVEGTDLRGLLNRERRLDPEHAVRIIDAVAAALDVAHAKGLVHRDIKPGNVLIEGSGSSEHVYLTDFGLARQIEASTGVTATGAFVGTLDYVAPEQIKGERVDARADVYALACVLFELLAGHPPFAAREDKVAKMYAHLQEEPPRLRVLAPELPGELDLVLARAMAKDPAERYPSAGDLARAAAAVIEGQPTVEAERSVATGAAAPGPAEATTTAARLRDEEATVAATVASASAGTREQATAARDVGDGSDGGGPPGGTLPVGTGARRRAERSGASGGRRGPLLAGVGVLAAAAVAAALLLGGGDGEETPSRATGSGTAAGGGGEGTPRAQVDGRPVPVGKLPVNLAHGEEGLWATNRVGRSVSLVDGDPAKQLEQFPVGTKAEGVAVGEGSIWVSSYNQPTLLRVDPESGSVEGTIAVGAPPGNVAFGEGAVWVANSGEKTVSKVDPQTGTASPITVGNAPYGLAIGGDAVWVTNRADDSITRINPVNGRVDSPIAVGDNPKGIALASDAVWVANSGDGTVSQVRGGTEQETIEVGPEPRGVTAGFGFVWVAVGGGDSVVQIDPRTAKVVDSITVGGGPEGIAAGPESVWVANGFDDTLTRIDPDSP